MMQMVQPTPYIGAAVRSPQDEISSSNSTVVVISVASYYNSGILIFPKVHHPQHRVSVKTHSILLQRTVAMLLVLAVIFLLVNAATARFVFDGTLILVMLIGALGLRVTDAIVRRDIH